MEAVFNADQEYIFYCAKGLYGPSNKQSLIQYIQNLYKMLLF